MYSVQLRNRWVTQKKQNSRCWIRVLNKTGSQQKRPDVALLAVEQLRQLENERAVDLIGSLTTREELSEWSDLWRYAVVGGRCCRQKAAGLWSIRSEPSRSTSSSRPDVINLESLRNDYSNLLTRFEEVVDASATLELPPPRELIARLIRAADQWRSIDDDDTQCCQMTARILTKLNRKDLAWDYVTTPLAESSGESAPWTSLAENLTEQKQVALADIAWERAFEFEQTNPDILLKHAQMLRDNGRQQQSKAVLERITSGKWQPRFSRTVQQAQQLLQ